MAAMFFQGVLGSFNSYNAFAGGAGASPPGSGLPPGYVNSQGYQRANPNVGGNQGGGYQPQPMQTNPAENPTTRVTSPTQNQGVKDEILKNK